MSIPIASAIKTIIGPSLGDTDQQPTRPSAVPISPKTSPMEHDKKAVEQGDSLSETEEAITKLAAHLLDDFFTNEDAAASGSENKDLYLFSVADRKYTIRKKYLQDKLLTNRQFTRNASKICSRDELRMIDRIWSTLAKEQHTGSHLSEVARSGLKALDNKFVWRRNSTVGRAIEQAVFNATLTHYKKEHLVKPRITRVKVKKSTSVHEAAVTELTPAPTPGPVFDLKEERIYRAALQSIDQFFVIEDRNARKSGNKEKRTFTFEGKLYEVRQRYLGDDLFNKAKVRKSRIAGECSPSDQEVITKIFSVISEQQNCPTSKGLSERALTGLKTMGNRFAWKVDSTPGRIIEDAIFQALLIEKTSSAYILDKNRQLPRSITQTA